MPSDATNDEDRNDPAVAEDDQPHEEPATSPVLEHLEETMKSAQQAADEALAPQRE